MNKLPFIFFTIAGLFCFTLFFATFYWGYKESFLVLNRLRFPISDRFFLWLTEFGNGFNLVIFALILACIDKKHSKTAITIIICIILTAIIVQICKQVLFPNWHRPAKLLQGQFFYVLVNPVPYHNSFPSGHSISVMSTATILSFVFRKPVFQVLIAIIGCSAAYTRIYVGAHFPADVAMGSFLGCVISTIIFYSLRKLNLSNIEHKPYFRYILYVITGICLILALAQASGIE